MNRSGPRRHDPDRGRRSGTDCPLTNGASASRIELVAAATHLGRLAVQRAGGRADFERALHRRIETAPDRDIERRDGTAPCAMSVKPASPRMRCTRSSEAKANGPGIFGSHAAAASARACRPPAAAPSSSGFSRGSRQQANASRPDGFSARRRLAKERTGLGKKHHAEARGQKIKTCRIERIDRGVRQHEIDRQARRRDLPRAGQHRARNVDARARGRSGRPFARTRWWWRRCRNRHR